MKTTSSKAQTRSVFINVPNADWPLFRELIRKFGWEAETREQMLERFANTRPTDADISEA